jgi:hypothetical protein
MRLKLGLIFFALFLTACGTTAAVAIDGEGNVADSPTATTGQVATEQPTDPAVDEASQSPTLEPSPSPTVEPTATPTADKAAPNPAATESGGSPELLPEEPPPPAAASQFSTDFSRHTVPYDDILSGGPPKDGIPAIDDPKFVTVEEADGWLKPQEPVILFQIGDDARAYPLQVLTWHEIVNDVVGGEPVSVTFCPLCNTGIAFERTFEGQVLDFGTTGRLRFSNLIMYDRQTETWWQQANGEGIAGQFAGRQLTFLPTAVVGWEDFKTAHPDGKVLSRDTGFRRDYGRNPYAGYDDVRNSPFLFDGPQTPGQLPAMARVLTVELDGETVAYPNDLLQETHVVNDVIAGTEVVVLWESGTASALDAGSLADGRDVGASAVYARELDGQTLDFRFDGDKIVDEQTGSEWNVLGQATSGPLAGSQLTPVVSVNHFWFSWAAFKPETRVYTP